MLIPMISEGLTDGSRSQSQQKRPNTAIAALSFRAKGRIKPDLAVVNGKQECHKEGAYYLEWREGAKRVRLSVGKDLADASARRQRKAALSPRIRRRGFLSARRLHMNHHHRRSEAEAYHRGHARTPAASSTLQCVRIHLLRLLSLRPRPALLQRSLQEAGTAGTTTRC
jgi:hypothetical protein